MNKLFILFSISIFIFFAWVSVEQHKSAKNYDQLSVQLETRARAIQSGHYDFSADSSLLIKEEI